MAEKQKSFEEKLKRLEEIVKILEKGDASLEDSLALFTEGAKLTELCQKQLDEAEQKVLKLSKGEGGAPVGEPFDAGAGESL